MNPEKYNRKIALLCPTCGCDQFAHEQEIDETIEVVKCASCGRELTKDDLIQENSENLSAHVDEVKKEVLQDIRKQFTNIFKK